MGTRNLTIVKVKGQVKLAQYCQWDGYPTGQGFDIADFLRRADLSKFKANVSKLTWVKKDALKTKWVECGANPDSDLVSMDIADKFKAKYPEFSRDTGAKVLGLIQRGRVKEVDNAIDFLKDTLFCEYAYEIDMDKKTVAVYVSDTKPYKVFKFKDFTRDNLRKLEKELRGDDN